jgi:hypothetical protein
MLLVVLDQISRVKLRVLFKNLVSRPKFRVFVVSHPTSFEPLVEGSNPETTLPVEPVRLYEAV